MKTAPNDDHAGLLAVDPLSLTGSHRRALEAIFRHPSAHNLEWRDVVGLIGQLGVAHERANNEFVFEVGGHRQIIHKPHTKDLTRDEVMELRHFLTQAGCAPGHASEAPAHPDPAAPGLLIVADHHGTKIFHLDLEADKIAEPVIRPDDPHHFLHHLTHKDQDRERGQRAPEEPAYYEAIADAVALGGQIVVVGHGSGHSNAAHHLVEYLKSHHPETYQRIVRELVADLSSITPPQLLDLARRALRP
jgi:hypothetical protein